MPCFLVNIAGSTFTVYGAVLSDTAIMDPLTPTYHFIWFKNNEKMMLLLSRAFQAILQTNGEVQEHSVYVKAVQRKYYSLQAYNFLLTNGNHALKIIEATYMPEEIIRVIQILHDNDYVHGDLCEGNILVCRHSERECGFDVKLINFEWSGLVGTACYSHFMNHIAIHWLEGAEDRKKVTKEHDNTMLEQTFQKTKLSQESNVSQESIVLQESNVSDMSIEQ
ncbi:11591_t:CDS:2 [Funneliformis caledonium]|uniref:11591_t:CDS:1 n=1 Tax=Funneliformis caledonium TaxID=1117310 RepID=A0A9N9EQE7_9GLOM|nr:11591_t:CDS:2 [Funneliformis caledonium]